MKLVISVAHEGLQAGGQEGHCGRLPALSGAEVVGIFPNEAAICRVVGDLLLEQNEEWAPQRRYLTLETRIEPEHNSNVSLPAVAA